VEAPMIEIRGERLPLTRGSHIRGWFVYQGGDYFEFREDGAERWQLSQSSEWDFHDPSHVVGRGTTLQAAAEDFGRSITSRIDRRPNTPRATSGGDLVSASLGLLIAVVSEATRLGYDDGSAGAAIRRGNGIAEALGLARWTGLQQLQLRHAYLIGRQHAVAERKRQGEAARLAMRPSHAPGPSPTATGRHARRHEVKFLVRRRVLRRFPAGSTRNQLGKTGSSRSVDPRCRDASEQDVPYPRTTTAVRTLAARRARRRFDRRLHRLRCRTRVLRLRRRPREAHRWPPSG
jgi:hypothetical protein